MIAIIAVGGALTILWGERIGIYNGEGWDGQAYAAWGRDFPKEVIETGVTEFQAERVLPSATLYYALGALGVEHTGGNVIAAFQILDLLSLVISAVFLVRIAVLLGWSRTATWVAFVATFLGFANAREALYYPTMTDPAAFALAMATVWAYLARRPIAQWVIAFASAFTWPALVAFGFAALILPRPVEPLPPTTGRWQRWLALGLALAAAVFVVAWFTFVLSHTENLGRWLPRSHEALYPVTIGCIVISTSAAAYIVARCDETWSIWPYLRGVGWRRIAFAVVGAAAILVIRARWEDVAGTKGPGFGWRELRMYYVANAVFAPLWNVVHQVTYFGPIVLLAIGAWPRVAATAARWGPASVLGLGIVVLSAVSSDSRHLLHMMPFVTVITVTATAAWWTPRRALVLAAIYLVWSKLWLHIGYTSVHDSLTWPDLRFFMQHGPWASDTTFLAHLAAAVVTALGLWLLLRGAARTSRSDVST